MFLQEHEIDSYFRQGSSTVRLYALTFNYYKNGVFVCHAPIDGAVQNFVQLLIEYVYYITRYIQYWLDTSVKEVCTTQCDANIMGHISQMTFKWLTDRVKCTLNKPSEKQPRPLQLFPANVHWNLFPWTSSTTSKDANPLPVSTVMKNRYTKLKRAFLLFRTTALHIASLFLDNCVIPCRNPEYVWWTTERSFSARFRVPMCQFRI